MSDIQRWAAAALELQKVMYRSTPATKASSTSPVPPGRTMYWKSGMTLSQLLISTS